MECAEVFHPVPPLQICDGFMQLARDCFLCGTNDRGFITLHILEETTKAEAWEFFENMRGVKCQHVNPRITFVGASPASAVNN